MKNSMQKLISSKIGSLTKILFSGLFISIAIFACSKHHGYEETPNPDPPSDGISIKEGHYLQDPCGNKINLRGVNMGSVYAVDFGSRELSEIAKTGANAVRIVLEKTYKDWSKGGLITNLSGGTIEELIKICLNNKMIPVLELHDYTGSSDPSSSVGGATDWWCSSAIRKSLEPYNGSIIINIANEPENGSGDPALLKNAYSAAINKMRNQKYTCPLMLDSYNWAKDANFVINFGNLLMQQDPLHNLIFSIHAYWPTHGAYGDYSDAKITADMTGLKNTDLPIVVGELAMADVQDQNYAINYTLIMKLCQQNGFGYLAWWWGFYNNPGANNILSMTNTGIYTGLTGPGKIIAVTDPYSIQRTSIRPCHL